MWVACCSGICQNWLTTDSYFFLPWNKDTYIVWTVKSVRSSWVIKARSCSCPAAQHTAQDEEAKVDRHPKLQRSKSVSVEKKFLEYKALSARRTTERYWSCPVLPPYLWSTWREMSKPFLGIGGCPQVGSGALHVRDSTRGSCSTLNFFRRNMRCIVEG